LDGTGAITISAAMPLSTTSSQASARAGQPEAKLVEQSLAGDPRAFRELVERYQESVWRTAYHLVGDRQWAYDISQEAFLRVYSNLARFDTRRSFWQWLRRIVVNLAIDHLRKRRRFTPLPLDYLAHLPAPATTEKTNSDELAEQVHRTLAQLPGKYRVPLVLRELEGLSAREVAKTLGLPYSLLRWRLSQGRKLFRQRWQARHKDKSD